MKTWHLVVVVSLMLGNTVSGYTILECGREGHNELDLQEDATAVLKCAGVQGPDFVAWSAIIARSRYYIGFCDASNQCQVKDNRYLITMGTSVSGARESRLKVTGEIAHRNKWEVQCYSVASKSDPKKWPDDTDYGWCPIRIVYTSTTPSRCQIDVDPDAHTMAAACSVEKAFAADMQYDCQWLQTFHNNQSSTDTWFKGHFSWVSYTETSTGRQYQRGTCTLPPVPLDVSGKYSYSVSITPGLRHTHVTTVHIAPQGEPTIQCPTGSKEDVSQPICRCSSSDASVGHPLPTLTWPGVTFSGLSVGADQDREHVDNVKTCQMSWDGPVSEPATHSQPGHHENISQRTHASTAQTEGLTAPITREYVDRQEASYLGVYIIGSVAGSLITAIIIGVIVALRRKFGTKQDQQSLSEEASTLCSPHGSDSYEDCLMYGNGEGSMSEETKLLRPVENETARDRSLNAYLHPVYRWPTLQSWPEGTQCTEQQDQLLDTASDDYASLHFEN